MSDTLLKNHLKDDLHTLKHLRLEILPANVFYKALIKCFLSAYLLLTGAMFAGSLFAYAIGTWNETPSFSFITFCILGMGLFFMLFLYGNIKTYVVFKCQIAEHLQTGQYIQKKSLQAFMIFIGIFGLFSLFSFSVLSPDLIGASAMMSFIPTIIIVSILIETEATRIGISPITNAVANYFEKHDKELTND